MANFHQNKHSTAKMDSAYRRLTSYKTQLRCTTETEVVTFQWLLHWLMSVQVGSGWITRDRRWSTKWRALSRWIFVCSVCSTVRCHRSVTRTTTVPVTRRASSTHTTLHSSPTRPTLSTTAPGPGGVWPSAPSSKPHCRHCAAALCSCSFFSNKHIIHEHIAFIFNL